ncbi:Pcs60p [Sugiyamaella lignohabitans]|uniref:Pcs60p n=1 Tax=Sugiyamaella lignohabitans TaxID=796027 RepID=A0A167DCE8_9ASCO|nr:Pcs60p [Sugiyamaella lignohabitans]ANB12756.1 Pcs60p [Sugiyamaella lignohabitans]
MLLYSSIRNFVAGRSLSTVARVQCVAQRTARSRRNVANRYRNFTSSSSRYRFISEELSHVTGPTEPPLSSHTIGSLVEETAKNYGHLNAVISMHQNVELTYSELDRLSSIVATNLAEKYGIKKNDRVSVCAGNIWEYPVLQIGLAKLGAIMIPLNPAFTHGQFHAGMEGSGSKVLIIQSHLHRGRRKPARDMEPLIQEILSKKNSPDIEAIFVIPPTSSTPEGNAIKGDALSKLSAKHTSEFKFHRGTIPFSNLLEDITPKEYDTDCQDTINMQFTSGTTSAPKITSLSHYNLVNNGRFIGNRMGLSATQSHHPTGQDHMCIPVPMFHCFGLVLSNLCAWSTGSCLVYPSDAFDPIASLTSVRKYSCTTLHGVPTMFAAQLDLNDGQQRGYEYLRTGIAAGSSVPIEIMKRLSQELHLNELTICYGMTETAPVSFMSHPNDSAERRCTTVGTIMPHTEAKIVRPGDDTLTPLPIGEKGEIVVAGYLLMKEYYRDASKTAEAIAVDADGKRWMKTGDEGQIDKEGFLTVTGRIKDLIIRGGENIHPLEIENALFTHDAVLQASVVGVPDKKYGEAICAFIVLDHTHKKDPPSIREIQEFVTERLGHYMAPKYVHYVDDFPKTASGKIRKVDLKQTAIELM